VPLEFFAPVSSSIGVQLLQKMGWRQGTGIGSKGAGSTSAAAGGSKSRAHKAAAARLGLIDEDGSLFGGLAELAGFRSRAGGPHTAGSDSDEGAAEGGQHGQAAGSSKWGAVSGVSIENTPLYVLEPKQDLHGLGFDPFEGAEEFRSRKRQKLDAARAATGGLSHHAAAAGGGGGFGGSGGRGRGAAAAGGGGGRARGIAFGTGALEESDTLGYVEDYIDADADVMADRGKRNEMFAFEEASDSGGTGFDVNKTAHTAAGAAAAVAAVH
jgi:G patch domain-containing protein 1